MVTGELGYNEAFGLSYEASNNSDVSSNIMYPETANLVWAVFLVLIPILLTNMLVSCCFFIVLFFEFNPFPFNSYHLLLPTPPLPSFPPPPLPLFLSPCFLFPS